MSMRRSLVLPSLLALAALALGGCEDINRGLGLEKVVPDEFAVVSRAPLAIPPDYALRPPNPGAAPTQEVSPTEQAKQVIFRAGDQQALPGADKRSEGENLLLKEAGAASAEPNIRQTITQEARDNSGVNDSFVDKLLFWRGPEEKLAADSVIDPNLEQTRLKGSQAAASAAPTPNGLAGAPRIERTKEPSMVATF
jgi:predicted small secreted protein